MPKPLREKLENLGLSRTEAGIYLILLRNRQALGASAIAARAEMARPSVYPAVTRLIDLGLVESEATYGSGFTAVLPGQAMQSLVARKNDELLQCKELATELAGELKTIIGPSDVSEIPESKMVQVLRDPRSVSQHFQRLELAAQRQMEFFVKGPYFNQVGNKAEQRALQRGVRVRAIYEKEGIEDPAVKPYFRNWIADGEEACLYPGALPHKMVIFDSQIVLMPLFTPGEEMRALLIHNAQLAESLSLAFQFIWDRSEPISTLENVLKTPEARSRAAQPTGRNGRRGPLTKKLARKV